MQERTLMQELRMARLLCQIIDLIAFIQCFHSASSSVKYFENRFQASSSASIYRFGPPLNALGIRFAPKSRS